MVPVKRPSCRSAPKHDSSDVTNAFYVPLGDIASRDTAGRRARIWRPVLARTAVGRRSPRAEPGPSRCGQNVHPLLSGRGTVAHRPVGHETGGTGRVPRPVQADLHDGPGRERLRSSAHARQTDAPSGPDPLGPPQDRGPQREHVLRAHRSLAGERRSADRSRRAGEFPALRRSAGPSKRRCRRLSICPT